MFAFGIHVEANLIEATQHAKTDEDARQIRVTMLEHLLSDEEGELVLPANEVSFSMRMKSGPQSPEMRTPSAIPTVAEPKQFTKFKDPASMFGKA